MRSASEERECSCKFTSQELINEFGAESVELYLSEKLLDGVAALLNPNGELLGIGAEPTG